MEQNLRAYFILHIITIKCIKCMQARSHGVAWGGTPGQQDAILSPLLRIFPPSFYGCLIIVAAKERSPKILVEVSLGLCNIQESSIFSCRHFIHLIVIL